VSNSLGSSPRRSTQDTETCSTNASLYGNVGFVKACALLTCTNEVKHEWATYCSGSCANRARPRRQRRCIDGVSRCSYPDCECQTRVARTKRLRLPNGKRKVVQDPGVCEVCGKPRSFRAWRYCASRDCQRIGQALRNPLLAPWINNEVSADGHGGRDRAGLAGWARNWLLNYVGWKCELCGWNTSHPTSGKPPLEVDHKDGNRNNNFRSNVWVLCPNCHALQPTNKGMNRNKYKDFPV
jgi:hypothetical protein